MGINSFFKRPEKFTDMSGLSPADKAKSTWDRREGRIVVQNYNLRLIIVGLIIIAVALTGGLVYQSSKSMLVPYVVEVDKATGAVTNAGTIKPNTEMPSNDAITQYFVKRFIINARSMPLDPVVYKSQLQLAYSFLTKDSAAKLEANIKSEKTMEKFGHKTIQVEIVSVLPVDDKDGGNGKNYQVRWNEEEFNIGGGDKVITPMSGIFTIRNIPIKDKDKSSLNDNPLSLFISDFSWTRDTSTVVNNKVKNSK